MTNRASIIVIVPRGEAVRNFIYSDTVKCLSENMDVTLLSVVTSEEILSGVRPFCREIVELKDFGASAPVRYLRTIVEDAHDRWLWSKVAQSQWAIRDRRFQENGKCFIWSLRKASASILAHRAIIELLSRAEQMAQVRFRRTRFFDELFTRIRPSVVFNGSHIHGPAGELPVRVASMRGIKTAGFIFSWDNLTSRSRILVPYDYYFVWHQDMKNLLQRIYPSIPDGRVLVTGTPQMDFHFRDEFLISRDQLCSNIGIDPGREFVLYTTAMDSDFPEEHRTVEFLINEVHAIPAPARPQLVVRMYTKGTSEEMRRLASKDIEDVSFIDMAWDRKWYTPLHEDLAIYTGLIRHCKLGVNAASTVTLELLMQDKPVINLAFDPPGSKLDKSMRWRRHIDFDHYHPVARSGAVTVADTPGELGAALKTYLANPKIHSERRHAFVDEMFGNLLDGKSGKRIAKELVRLSQGN